MLCSCLRVDIKLKLKLIKPVVVRLFKVVLFCVLLLYFYYHSSQILALSEILKRRKMEGNTKYKPQL